MALTVAGPVGCKQGWKEGRRDGKVGFTDGSMAELGGASILGLDGKVYPYRLHDPIALAHPRRCFSTAPTTTWCLHQFALPSGF